MGSLNRRPLGWHCPGKTFKVDTKASENISHGVTLMKYCTVSVEVTSNEQSRVHLSWTCEGKAANDKKLECCAAIDIPK